MEGGRLECTIVICSAISPTYSSCTGGQGTHGSSCFKTPWCALASREQPIAAIPQGAVLDLLLDVSLHTANIS